MTANRNTAFSPITAELEYADHIKLILDIVLVSLLLLPIRASHRSNSSLRSSSQ